MFVSNQMEAYIIGRIFRVVLMWGFNKEQDTGMKSWRPRICGLAEFIFMGKGNKDVLT
jgi:hypothetical protein